jgi:hypothetical protein
MGFSSRQTYADVPMVLLVVRALRCNELEASGRAMRV